MTRAIRDRVSIDLRGIGDAVRDTARARNTTIAALARQALVSSVAELAAPATALEATGCAAPRATIKVTLRLPAADAERLVLSARSLGLSYGAFVARLVKGTPLPQPSVDRRADRAALLRSSDQLATLSTDLNAFMRLLRLARSDELEAYRQRIASVDTEIRRHLDRVSAFASCP